MNPFAGTLRIPALGRGPLRRLLLTLAVAAAAVLLAGAYTRSLISST
jgi:hypothetical protein